MSNKPKRNRKLIRHVADVIESFPEEYNQGAWSLSQTGQANLEAIKFEDNGTLKVYCGSQQCICGWGAILAGWKPIYNNNLSWEARKGAAKLDYKKIGRTEFGLTETEASILFHMNWVPKGYRPTWKKETLARHVAEELRAIADGGEIVFRVYDSYAEKLITDVRMMEEYI